MIINGLWDVFSLPDPHNKEKKWDLLLHQSRFPFDYIKFHINSLQKVSKADKYMVQNLTCSREYLRITLSSTLLQKLLKLVLLTATGPKVYIFIMITVISRYCASLVENLNHMKSLKPKYHPGENVTDWRNAILVYSERLENAGAFNPEYLGYIIHIFEDTYGSRFHIWETQKYRRLRSLLRNFVCVANM